jgi:threonylcarbamoyladenosine tRNA methylthiotransferase MtaB
MDFDRSLVDLLSNQRLCPHLHLPLQSGSNTILAKMRRPYTVDEYRDLTESVRAVSPDISITTDVMVGFPGETDTDFAETVTFINEIEFAALHVFPYSRRLRTLAAHSEQTVDATVKRARVSALIDLAAIGSLQYASRFDDTVRQIVWERAIDGLLVGLTDNYLRVTSRAATDLAGKLGLARLQIRSDGDIMAVPTGRAESGAT